MEDVITLGVALVVGALSIAGGITKLVRARRLKAVAVCTTGVVTALRGSHRGWYPVFRFTVDGREVEVQSDVGRSPPSQRVGETVLVLYDPADPSHARIAGWAHSGAFAAVILIGVGVGFLVTAVLVGTAS